MTRKNPTTLAASTPVRTPAPARPTPPDPGRTEARATVAEALAIAAAALALVGPRLGAARYTPIREETMAQLAEEVARAARWAALSRTGWHRFRGRRRS